MSIMVILFTARPSILRFNSTNCGGFMPSSFSSGVPRDTIERRNPCLLVRDDKRMKMCGKALGVSWWMQSLGKSLGQKPFGDLRPAGFRPRDFNRDSILHDTPLPFLHMVSIYRPWISNIGRVKSCPGCRKNAEEGSPRWWNIQAWAGGAGILLRVLLSSWYYHILSA